MVAWKAMSLDSVLMVKHVIQAHLMLNDVERQAVLEGWSNEHEATIASLNQVYSAQHTAIACAVV